MAKKADIGTFQELQPNGKIAESWTRKLSAVTFVFLWVYTAFSCYSYETHFNKYTDMVTSKAISEQSFNLSVSELKMINWDVFLILIVATVAPKIVQKFAEYKGTINSEKPITQ
jgi:hypothetical protein